MDFTTAHYAINKVYERVKASGGAGYAEAGNTVFPRTAIALANGSYASDKYIPLEKGKLYVLTWDGNDGYNFGTSTATAEAFTETEVEYGVSVTWSLTIKDESGDIVGIMPFMVMSVYPAYQELVGSATLFTFGEADAYNGTFTVSITTPETIHPIDPKFIPGAVLPVVELETTVTSGAAFTEVENSALNKMWENSGPVLMRCNLSYEGSNVSFAMDNTAMVANRGTLSESSAYPKGRVYSFSVGSIIFQLISPDGSYWYGNATVF